MADDLQSGGHGVGAAAAAIVTTHTVLSVGRHPNEPSGEDALLLGTADVSGEGGDPWRHQQPRQQQQHHNHQPGSPTGRSRSQNRSRGSHHVQIRGALGSRPRRISSSHNLGPGLSSLPGDGSPLWYWLLPTKLDREVALNALAVAGASMADPLMSLVDTAMVGRLGTAPLAALGSNGALFNCLFFLFFTALAVICTQAMAQAHARGDVAGVGRGFVQAMCAMVAVSGGLLVLLTAAPEHVLSLFATNSEMMEAAKTYLSIRALSLPAALFMCVSQAAFRSLLDLRTPLIVVCVSNASNYILDEIFMFNMGGGMAGCGWASVVSQYLGAALFVVLISRRGDFGLREALDAAAEAELTGAAGGGSIAGGAPGGGRGVSLSLSRKRSSLDLELNMKPLHHDSSCPAAPRDAPGSVGGGALHRHSDCSGGKGGCGCTCGACGACCSGLGSDCDDGALSGDATPPGQVHLQKAHHRAVAAGASVADRAHSPLRARCLAGPGANGAAAGAGSKGGGGSRGGGRGGTVAAAVAAMPLRRKAVLLLWSLPWRPFLRRFAGLSVRGGLILSTYTSASVVAARAGTAVIAGHQVVQQHQQLQMSVAWSFLHVAQSMVANMYHSAAGPKAAKRLAARIVLLATVYCVLASLATLSLRSVLPRVFTHDPAILALVRSAEVPAALMMALGVNCCLEGCLLAADDSAFVVRAYPFAAAAALAQLAATGMTHSSGAATLRGVWWGLCMYYLVLLIGFAGRCAWRVRRGG